VLKLINWELASATDAAPSPADASAAKVYGTELATEAYRLLMEVLGTAATLRTNTPGALLRGRIERMHRSCLILTFGGGTNEIQRDIIGMVALGLRVNRYDLDMDFKTTEAPRTSATGSTITGRCARLSASVARRADSASTAPVGKLIEADILSTRAGIVGRRRIRRLGRSPLVARQADGRGAYSSRPRRRRRPGEVRARTAEAGWAPSTARRSWPSLDGDMGEGPVQGRRPAILPADRLPYAGAFGPIADAFLVLPKLIRAPRFRCRQGDAGYRLSLNTTGHGKCASNARRRAGVRPARRR
jgi:hypothetical protein